MNTRIGKSLGALLLGAAMAASPGVHAAFKVDSFTVDGGGGRSEGARFSVTGTIGQPDADPLQPSTSSGGRFSATGGYWAASATTGSRIFRDGFE